MSMMRTEVAADAAHAPPLAPLTMPVQVLESDPASRAGVVRLAWRALMGARRRSAE